MAPINWDAIMDVESTELSDDAADELYEMLSEVTKKHSFQQTNYVFMHVS